jgi:hypothetical protein
LTDAVWLYNTAANCQSVEQVVAGIACVAISLFGLEIGKMIASRTCDLLAKNFSILSKSKDEVTPSNVSGKRNSAPIHSDIKANRIKKSNKTQKIKLQVQKPKPRNDNASSEITYEAKVQINKKISDSKACSHLWVTAGTLTGLILGGSANLIATGSIFEKDKRRCENNPFGGITPLIAINALRESQLELAREDDLLIPIHPVLPFIYLVPLFAFAIWNTIPEKNSISEKGWKKVASVANRGWKQLSKNVIIPAAYSSIMAIGGLLVREYVFNHSNNQVLDISGHVILQIAQNLCVMKSLQGLEETGSLLQARTIKIFHAAVAITDGVWMFNTSANCHSVADAVVGLACNCLTYFGIETCKLLLTKGFNRAQHMIKPLTITSKPAVK